MEEKVSRVSRTELLWGRKSWGGGAGSRAGTQQDVVGVESLQGG